MLRTLFVFVILSAVFTASLSANSLSFSDSPEVSFVVEYNEFADVATLTWTCQEVSEVKMFVCEKSLDGVTFEEITRVEVGESSYLEFDEYAIEEVQYYRIVVQLKSGNKMISEVQKATKSVEKSEIKTTFYPNPVMESANIMISNYQGDTVEIVLYNSLGEEVFMAVDQTGASHSINCKEHTPGTYFIKAKVGDEVFVEKIDIID